MSEVGRDTSLDELRAHPRVHWDPGSFEGVAAQRIVSLVPSLSEALVVLGLGDRLVGVTEYCVHPHGAFAGLPRVGGTKDADVAAIAKLSPDLVIGNQEENTVRVVRKLADSDIDIWVTYPRTVRDGARLLEELAGLGATAEAIESVVVPVRQALEAALLRRLSSSAPHPRVFCPIWRDPWMTINRDTYIHDLIDLCGGDNIFAGSIDVSDPVKSGSMGEEPGSDRRYPVLSLDELIERQPEVILLPDEPYAFGSADLELLASLEMPASRNGRIHLIDGTLVSWYGPRIAESIRIVADLFANRNHV